MPIPNGNEANDGVEAVEQSVQTLERTAQMTKFSAFLNDETGAVTVDWVVLTAAVVGLGLVVFTFVQPAISQLASDIGAEVDAAGVKMQAADE
jgi:Flp pilus assembly pilin Flp